MVEQSALLALVSRLEEGDVEMKRMILRAVDKLLEAGESVDSANTLAIHFNAIGGLKKLESMQHHPNKEIYDMTTGIMKKFFSVEEVTEVTDLT